ncbi:pyocin knob domain-containing protein [uncultured Anaerococcus sp.]|uniref:pyocin knob domain-containing protein n=1 Tax=uncultured Anaerococcus sp. TaxID=293428 RepID=UPI0025DC4FD4|nr:pyocin knob domain-containing protein [uncultured Anaerococcus sp.]
MAIKVLDYNGLKQLTSKLKDYVQKSISGKANNSDLTKLIEDLKIQDTRGVNENPDYYIKNKPMEVVKELKTLKTLGINSSLSDAFLLTMFPWRNNSAGYPVQMAFRLNSDEIYTRIGISDTDWGKWRKILDDTDLKTKLSQLSEDSKHRTVTDAEKSKWNAKAEKSYVDSAKTSVEKNTKTLTDALAKDLKEKVDSINATKADKTALNNYVKKVSGKGLSTNDFTNAYKSNIDKNLRDDAQVMRLALKVARRDTLFQSNELYKDLNNYYGTSISSSIRTLDQFQKSPTAMGQLLNNEVAKREMNGDLAYSRAIFEACMPYFKDRNKTDELRPYLKNDFTFKAIVTSPKSLKTIISDDALLKLNFEDSMTGYRTIQACPYIHHGSLYYENEGDIVNGFLTNEDFRYKEVLWSSKKMLVLGFQAVSSYYYERNRPSGVLVNIRDRSGTSKDIDNEDDFFLKTEWKAQEANKKLLFATAVKDDGKFNDYKEKDKFLNIVYKYGYIQCDGVNPNIPKKLSFSLLFLDLMEIEQDLARGL